MMKIVYIIYLVLISFAISEDECDKGYELLQCKECNGKECKMCNNGSYLKSGKCENCPVLFPSCKLCNETECHNCDSFFIKKDGKCINSRMRRDKPSESF